MKYALLLLTLFSTLAMSAERSVEHEVWLRYNVSNPTKVPEVLYTAPTLTIGYADFKVTVIRKGRDYHPVPEGASIVPWNVAPAQVTLP